MAELKKILILAANPKNTSRLRLDEEVREIEEGLQRSRNRDLFTVRSKWALRLKDLRRALLDYEPHIVHFSGHGATDGLVLEDSGGNAVIVGPEAVEGLFALFSDKVDCVLLNACYSEVQANAIRRKIPYVIGMSEEIGDEAALEFSMGFYDALGAGRSIEEAFRFGCNAIQLCGQPQEMIPVLLENTDVNLEASAGQSSDYVFRFRAECQYDVDELRRILGPCVTKITMVNLLPFPDTEVEIDVNLSLEQLRDAMRQVEDGHVMVQTVVLRDEYTGERNYDL